MYKWKELSYNKYKDRNEELWDKRDEVKPTYRLYEDLYACNTLSVEQVYFEIVLL